MHSFRSSVATESLSFTISDSSHQSNRRQHERTVIFATRLECALLIIGLQTGVMELMVTFIQVENNSGALIFVSTFVLAMFVTLPMMVHQIFYGLYNRYGFVKFWNMAPVAFGIGFTMVVYSVYECILWAAITGLLILHSCYIPFRSISEWSTCSNIERPEEIICYDAKSSLPSAPCQLTTYPALEFYKKISYQPQLDEGYSGINGAWFVCCLVVWLIVFVMVSQGFRRLKTILIRISMACLLTLLLLAVFSFSSQQKAGVPPEQGAILDQINSTRITLVWLVWHAIRVVQIQLGTLSQLGSYFPPESPLIADTVMILLFVCFYNLGFAYFAHYCHIWITAHFVGIEHQCLASDSLAALFGSVPTAISFLAMGNLWLFLFYTTFAMKTIIQIVITLTATLNALSEVFRLHRHRQQIVAVLCTVALLLDLPFTMTDSELFLAHIYRFVELIVDFCIVTISLLIIICIYSLRRVFDDIHFAYGVEPARFPKVISYLSPFLVGFVVITAFTSVIFQWSSDPTLADGWTRMFVWLTALVLLAPIPGFALYVYVIHLMKHNISEMLQPTATWGPPEADVKRARLEFNPRTSLRYRSKKPCTHNCLLNNLRIKIEVEKRESQRKEFFLNVFESPSYAEWDDDEDWHYGHDIIGKARTINWAGDFRTSNKIADQAINPTTVSKENEEQGEHRVEDDGEKGGNVTVQEDVESRTKPEEDVNADVDMKVISEIDDPYKPEMDSEPDIILPNLNTVGPPSGVQNLDTHHAVDQALPGPTPRYGTDLPERPRRRRLSTRERLAEHQVKPAQLVRHSSIHEPSHHETSMTSIPNNYHTSGIAKRAKRQCRSESCQTEKGLKRIGRLVLGILKPWKRNKRKKHRCIGTCPHTRSSTGASSAVSYDSTDESSTFTEMDEWP